MMKLCLLLLITLGLNAQEPLYEYILKNDSYKDNILKSKSSPYSLEVNKLTFSPKAPFAAEFKNHKALLRIPQKKFTYKSFSVEAWVKIDELSKWGGLISAFQDNGNHERGWLLGYKNDSFCFTVVGEKNLKLDYMTAKSTFSPGFWYHLTGTYDGQTQKLYADGKIIASKITKGSLLKASDNDYIALGSYMDDNDFYPLKGEISRVALFNSALKSEQIKKRFNKYKSHYPGIEGTAENKGDWLTYMGDNIRSGISPTKLSFPLKAQ